MTSILTSERQREYCDGRGENKDTQRRRQCGVEDRGSDWSDVATRKPGNADSYQKLD